MSRVITPEAVVSYPHLFEPDDKGKFGCALVFTKGTDLTALKKAALEVVKEKFGAKTAEMIRKGQIRFEGGAHHIFRTDGEEKYGEGAVFINARSKTPPGIVSVFPDKDGKPSLITDEAQVYPGMVARASVTLYWYDAEGNKGFAWALNNLQKLRDGDRLDNRVAARDEFEVDPNAVADLDALTAEDEPADDDAIAALLS